MRELSASGLPLERIHRVHVATEMIRRDLAGLVAREIQPAQRGQPFHERAIRIEVAIREREVECDHRGKPRWAREQQRPDRLGTGDAQCLHVRMPDLAKHLVTPDLEPLEPRCCGEDALCRIVRDHADAPERELGQPTSRALRQAQRGPLDPIRRAGDARSSHLVVRCRAREPRVELGGLVEPDPGDEPIIDADDRCELVTQPLPQQRRAIRGALGEVEGDQLAARIAHGMEKIGVDRELLEIEFLGQLRFDLASRHAIV